MNMTQYLNVFRDYACDFGHFSNNNNNLFSCNYENPLDLI